MFPYGCLHVLELTDHFADRPEQRALQSRIQWQRAQVWTRDAPTGVVWEVAGPRDVAQGMAQGPVQQGPDFHEVGQAAGDAGLSSERERCDQHATSSVPLY